MIPLLLFLAMMQTGRAQTNPYNYISGEPGPTFITQPVIITTKKASNLEWGDPKGSLPLTCKPDATGTGWVCKVARECLSDSPPLHWIYCGDSPVADGAETVKPPSTTGVPTGSGAWDVKIPLPVDVPAIHRHSRYDEPPPWIDYWTCADPKRILEHDEQEKPMYWCRRVQ
jgi:hypothetical protein